MPRTFPRPSECPHCLRQRDRAFDARTRRALVGLARVSIKTWCRICGNPVLLKIVGDYDAAKRWAYALDDQQMTHHGIHEERGGWGIHWRLDEVLSLIYPIHDEPCWPEPAWYNHVAALDHPIEILTDAEVRLFHNGAIDHRRAELEDFIQRLSREELTQHGPVWNESELVNDFDLLGLRAPFAVVVRKSDKLRGTMLFQNEPRFYFGFDTGRII